MDGLQTQMAGAMVSDQRKEQVNDAKLRAVGQRVDYDEFVKFVAGAHLKPVKPCSKQSAAISKPFEHFVMPKYEPPAAPVAGPVAAGGSSSSAADTPAPPKDANDFTKSWRRKCKTTEQKLAYLRGIEPEAFPLLFRAEMDPSVLDGVAEALRLCATGPAVTAESEVWAGKLLQQLVRVNRFELTLQLADEKSTSAIRDVFNVLASSAAPETGDTEAGQLSQPELAELRAKYGV